MSLITRMTVPVNSKTLFGSDPSRSNRCEEVLKRAAKRTKWYSLRALEATDEADVESVQGAISLADWQLNAAREV